MTVQELENKLYPNPYIEIIIDNMPKSKRLNDIENREIVETRTCLNNYGTYHSCESVTEYHLKIEWTEEEIIEEEKRKEQEKIDNKPVYLYAKVDEYHTIMGAYTEKVARELRNKSLIYIEYNSWDEYLKMRP